MSRRALRAVVVYCVAMLCLIAFFLMSGCKGIQGGVIGAGTGAAATGTPQGAGVGAAAGFVVGLWNDITTAVSDWWNSMFGGGEAIASVSSDARSEITGWLVLIAVFWLLYKLVFDCDFREHVIGFFKRILNPKPRRKQNADRAP